MVIAAGVLGAAAPSLGQSSAYRLREDRTWSVESTAQPGTDAWTIAEARRLLAEDRPDEARELLDDWIEANERTQNPLLAEAYLLRGDALVAIDREFRALYDYEAVAKGFRQSEQFPLAVRRELEIAKRYARGLKLRSMGFRWGDASDLVEEILIRVQERMPRSALAEEAAIELADFYYRRREMTLAREAYDLYLMNFPDGPNRTRAHSRRILTDVATFKGPAYSAAGLINARLQIRDFMSRYPAEADRIGVNEALIARIDESLAAQLLDTAEWYLQVKDEPSARFTLRRLVRDYPRTVAAERAERMLLDKGWLEATDPRIDEGRENAASPEPVGAAADPDHEAEDQSEPAAEEELP